MNAACTIARRAFTPGGVDRLGNRVDAWAAPVPVAALAVFSAAADGTGGASVAASSARHALTRHLVILARPGTPNAHRDRWVIEGVEYEQVGQAEDFTHTPFPPILGAPVIGGLRLHVKHQEG